MSETNSDTPESHLPMNYDLLVASVSKQELDAYRKSIGEKPASRKITFVASIILGSFLWLSVMELVISIKDDARTLFAAWAIMVLVANITLLIFRHIMLLRHRKLARMHRFAKGNNIEVIDGASGFHRSGIVFDAGHSGTVDMGYRLPSGVEIGNYQYVVGQGRYETTLKWGFIKIPSPRRLPHLLLDSRQNNLTKHMTNLPTRYKFTQMLELEGDFNAYFNVYVPGDYQTDALYVLTPDVMAMLIDKARSFDIEIVGDQIYLYKEGSFRLDDVVVVQRLFTLANTVAEQIIKQSKYYADSRVEGARIKNVVARPGKRLKKRHRVPVLLTVMLGLVASFVLFVLFYKSKIFVFAFLAIAFLTVVIGVVFGILKLIRLYKMSKGDD